MRYLFQMVLIPICTFQMVKISGQTVQMVSRMSMLIMNILKAQATTVVSAKDGDVDMHSEEVQETNAIKTISRYHYLNQPVRCLGLFGHMQ